MVMIDCGSTQEEVPRFRGLRAERRKNRIRDGARQGGLCRDFGRQEVWTESYHAPTGGDYLRHNMRRTKADAENIELIRKLHRGETPPKVRRMIERQTVPLRDDTPLRDTPEV